MMVVTPYTLLTVLPFGAYYVSNKTLELSDFVICIILSLGIVGPLITVGSYTDDLGKIGVIVDEIAGILEQPELKRPDKSKDVPKDNSIILENVRFGYHDKEILHGVTMELKAGTVNAIVGPSGSGKTSIGSRIFGEPIYDLYAGWDATKPIVDCIAPDGDFNAVTGALSAVGLGDVPAWLRPFPVLSNGEKFRAGLARLVCERPKRAVVDEFTSVIDRQIAKVGAAAFAKTWRKGDGQVVLLSCHYDIIEWLQPDWVYAMQEARFYNRDCLQRRPQLKLQIYKVRGTVFPRLFKQHYYLDLPAPVAAEYFVGFINGEPVCHVAVSPLFTAGAYRATRLVVMPEWQGIGVGTKFLAAVCEYHRQGHGRCGKMLPVFFHTSHPQLCGALRHSRKWVQTAASLYGANKTKSISSMIKSAARKGQPGRPTSGYGGHFRAVQAFKYINNGC